MKPVQFLAVIFTALALVPGAAHVLEPPHKQAMEQSAHLTTQTIDRGWRGSARCCHQINALLFALGGVMSLGSPFMIFFVWTSPGERSGQELDRRAGGLRAVADAMGILTCR